MNELTCLSLDRANILSSGSHGDRSLASEDQRNEEWGLEALFSWRAG